MCDGRTMVNGKPVAAPASRSTCSQAALSRLYCQYGFDSGVVSSRTT
nr:hypothetical protein [uncultured Demequina sp.]